MDSFAWATVPTRRRHFISPRFTEFVPVSPTRPAGESPLVTGPDPFDRAVLSWNGVGNLRLEMRLLVARRPGAVGKDIRLTPYYPMGVLSGNAQRSATKAELARAVSGAEPAPVALQIDALAVQNGAVAVGFQIRATGTGSLGSLSVAHYRRDDRRWTDQPAVPGAWGTVLPVPERSQRDIEEPRLGGIVCSPTSMSMILDYHGSPYRTLDVARAVQDPQSGAYGNWPCNTGAVARLLTRGGWSAVVKMAGFDDLEREIAARRPVALSHRWQKGDLPQAPISQSAGHLIVAVGFTETGDIVVNDPAAKAGEVRRVYRRRDLFRTWQERGQGIAYLVQPQPGVA